MFPCNVVSEEDQDQFVEFLIVIVGLIAGRVMDVGSDKVLSYRGNGRFDIWTR